MSIFALLPSPLLGPAAWEPAAEALRALGRTVLVAPVPPAPDGPAEVLAGFVTALPMDRQIVLVPHSNAGLYVPALAAAGNVAAVVFVDAALPDAGVPDAGPSGGGGSTALAPPALRRLLVGLAGPDGLLPPWTQWWDRAEVDALFPSADARNRVEKSQPRLRLDYFDASLPVPAHWDRTACAYLAFGETYAPERAAAEARGWPTAVLPGTHLHMLGAPSVVAAEVDRLAGALLG